MTEKLPPGPCSSGRGLGKSSCWAFAALWGLFRLCVVAQEAWKALSSLSNGWRLKESRECLFNYPDLGSEKQVCLLSLLQFSALPPAKIINLLWRFLWRRWGGISPSYRPGSGAQEESSSPHSQDTHRCYLRSELGLGDTEM